MGEHDNNDPFSNPKASILLFGICSAALVVSVYHCIVAGWCRSRPGALQNTNRSPLPRTLVDDHPVEPSTEENSTAYLISAHKYQKGDSLVGESTCSICMCEFEEGEELKTLPECSHPFHAPCIDMWLYSHTSCPMCRAQATPSPRMTFPSSSPGSNPPDQLTLERVIVHSSVL